MSSDKKSQAALNAEALADINAADGLLVSEWPPGTVPDAWRFPERNRIIAGLSEVLVVVESRERGGSLITARLAADRGVEVMVVPGSTSWKEAVGMTCCQGVQMPMAYPPLST